MATEKIFRIFFKKDLRELDKKRTGFQEGLHLLYFARKLLSVYEQALHEKKGFCLFSIHVFYMNKDICYTIGTYNMDLYNRL